MPKDQTKQLLWSKISTDQDQEKYTFLSFTSTAAYSQISAVVRINIRKKEQKGGPDLHGFKYEMTNVIAKGTELTAITGLNFLCQKNV